MKKFINVIVQLSKAKKIAACIVLALAVTSGVIGVQEAKKAEAVSEQSVRTSAEEKANNQIRKEIEKMLASSSLSDKEKDAFSASAKKAKDGASLLALKDSITEANAEKAEESSTVTPQQEVAEKQAEAAKQEEAQKQAEDAQKASEDAQKATQSQPSKPAEVKKSSNTTSKSSAPAKQSTQPAPKASAPAPQESSQPATSTAPQQSQTNDEDEAAFFNAVYESGGM